MLGATSMPSSVNLSSRFKSKKLPSSPVSRLKWPFDFQLQLFRQFLVEAVDVGLGANDQKVVNVGRDVGHLLLVLEDCALKAFEIVPFTNLCEELVPV